jgi:hypothetical protein
MKPIQAWATRLIAIAMLLSFALNSYALPSHPIAPADGPPGDVFVGDPDTGYGRNEPYIDFEAAVTQVLETQVSMLLHVQLNFVRVANTKRAVSRAASKSEVKRRD